MLRKKLQKPILIMVTMLLFSCFGSDFGKPKEEVNTYTIYSTPSACSSPSLTVGWAELLFCLNYKNPNKTIDNGESYYGRLRPIPEFTPEWGTQYKITVIEGSDGTFGSSYIELLNAEVTSLDPIGTIYTYTRTDERPIAITRADRPGYWVLGYQVTCEDAICEDVKGNIDGATFELVEVDGERRIKIIAVEEWSPKVI